MRSIRRRVSTGSSAFCVFVNDSYPLNPEGNCYFSNKF